MVLVPTLYRRGSDGAEVWDNAPEWSSCILPGPKLSPNVSGQPVCGKPILIYAHLIGEEYEKKREALMLYYDNDVVKTTQYLDKKDEMHLLYRYQRWMSREAPFDPWKDDEHVWENPCPERARLFSVFKGCH